MTTIVGPKRRLSPSRLAPRILCKAYQPKAFPEGEEGERLRWRHSAEIVLVLKRLLQASYQILGIELPSNWGRIDLLVRDPDGQRIAIEVKSHKEITELDKIQAGLYWQAEFDKIGVANRLNVVFLEAEYVHMVRAAGNIAQEYLEKQPQLTAVSFTPHRDICKLCSNQNCPHRTTILEGKSPCRD